MMVGYQIMLEGVVVGTVKLYHPFDLGDVKPIKICVRCQQISGHLYNDNKQINILTGQHSYSVLYPISCCMISKKNFGVSSEWIQWQLLRKSVVSVGLVTSLPLFLSVSDSLSFNTFISCVLSHPILE